MNSWASACLMTTPGMYREPVHALLGTTLHFVWGQDQRPCSTKHMLIIPCQNFFFLQHKFCKGSQESCLWTHWKGTSSVKPVYGEAPMMTKFVKSIFPYNQCNKKSFSIRRICYKHESVLSLFVVIMCYRILSCTESLIQLLNKYNDILA